jgi:hypothetical protein
MSNQERALRRGDIVELTYSTTIIGYLYEADRENTTICLSSDFDNPKLFKSVPSQRVSGLYLHERPKEKGGELVQFPRPVEQPQVESVDPEPVA